MKTIYLLELNGKLCRNVDIARKMDVTKPTVTVSLKELEKYGYIIFDENKLIRLTNDGREIAKEVYERYLFFKTILTKSGTDSYMAEEQACLLEHDVSEESFHLLRKYVEVEN